MMLALIATAGLLAAGNDVSGTVTLSSGKIAGQAVVYLEGAIKSTPMRGVVIDQRNRSFSPHISVVTIGSKIDFPNHDVVFHNVFTEYQSERFDFGMYARGRSKQKSFDRPGLAVLLCSVHPEMSAYVMCVDTPFYGIANRKGSFKIANVAPGDYTLRVWHESGETRSQPIRVSGDSILRLTTAK